MKIVHLCLSSFFIDGYSYQENLLPKYHVKQGHNVTVIASTVSFGKDGKGTYVSPGIHYENGYKVIRIPYKAGVFSKIWKRLRVYPDTSKLLENENPDIIFSHGVQYLDASKVTKYVKEHPNVRLFGDNHADYINSSKNFLSKYILHKIIWKYTANAICKYSVRCYGVTPLRCSYLIDMYNLPKEKVQYLPLGIDDEAIPQDRFVMRTKIRESLALSMDDFVIITGGKIDKLKNTHHLLCSLRKLGNKKICLILFGTITQEMQQIINEYKDDSNVRFVGWCNAEQVMNYLIASDLAFFPGTHSTLWEQAVGLGLPAVFKDWGDGFRHLNVNGNCLFIKGEDENEISDVVSSLFFTKRYEQLKLLSQEACKNFMYSEIAKRAII